MLLHHTWCIGKEASLDKRGVAPSLFLPLANPLDCRILWLHASWRCDAVSKACLWLRLAATVPASVDIRAWLGNILGASQRHGKVAAVVSAIEATGSRPEDLLRTIDAFAQTGPGRWLKVAGGEKASLLLEEAFAVRRRGSLRTRLGVEAGPEVVELGSFVGYSTVRLTDQLHRGKPKRPTMMSFIMTSFEGDPVHAAVARHVVDRARLSHLAEVVLGQVRDASLGLPDFFGAHVVRFIFMDQGGSAFSLDRAQLDCLASCSPAVGVVADNVLRPGAPLYLWAELRSASWKSNGALAWSLPEFLEEHAGVEDWMLASS